MSSRSEDNGSVASGIGGQVWPDDPLGGWVEVVDRGLFFPSRLSEAAALQEGVGHHCHERVTVQADPRSEEHTSELQSLMRISYAVFCLKKKNTYHHYHI